MAQFKCPHCGESTELPPATQPAAPESHNDWCMKNYGYDKGKHQPALLGPEHGVTYAEESGKAPDGTK